MGRFRNRWMARSILIGALACAAVGGSATQAFADVEPNNIISQAEGPIAGGVPIDGNLATINDIDYYVFYAASQQQIHLTSSILSGQSSYCLDVTLLGTDGYVLSSNYTTPIGVNRYFIRVESDSCAAVNYRFQVDPPAAVTTGPALDHTVTETAEPNETPGQASGPLAANVNYTGVHETTNDEDWFYFLVPPGTHQLDVATTGTGSYSDCTEVALYGAGGTSSIASARGSTSTFGHIKQTVTGPSRYHLLAGPEGGSSSCVGGRWQFRIETPDAVTASNPVTTPPPPPPPGRSTTPMAVTNYSTYLTLRRRGAKYSGRLTSSRAGCKVGRLVILRRAGSGTKRFGTTYSRGDGTFTIKRSFRLRGQVYAMAAGRASGSTICRNGRSPTIRG